MARLGLQLRRKYMYVNDKYMCVQVWWSRASVYRFGRCGELQCAVS